MRSSRIQEPGTDETRGMRQPPPEIPGQDDDESFLDDDSRYEKVMEELLRESIVSTDSFLNFFYAGNPVVSPKPRAPRQFSTNNEGLSFAAVDEVSIIHDNNDVSLASQVDSQTSFDENKA